MDNRSEDTHSGAAPHVETRAAIDVMFEALSHIQASINTSTEEERVESYRKFKEALYERFEHLLDKRLDETARDAAPEAGNGDSGDSHTQKKTEPASNGAAGEDDDTLGKLWPSNTGKDHTPEG